MIYQIIFYTLQLFIIPNFLFAARPPSKKCDITAKVISIEKLSENTGNGALVTMQINILQSSCSNKTGKKQIRFYWDPKARFKYRSEKLGQANKEINKVATFEAGIVFKAVMDSYDSTLSQLNGIKLPSP